MRKLNLKLKKKGQTALEYALVVGAISLVIMAAWNTVGKSVQESIRGQLLNKISNQLEKGNDAIKR